MKGTPTTIVQVTAMLLSVTAHAAGPARIIAGAPTHEHPAVVALVDGDRVRCSATLIHPRGLLTAAHCVASNIDRLEVVVGSSVRDRQQTVRLRGAWLHPRFDAATLANDVAIAELEAPFERIVAVPTFGRGDLNGVQVRVVGFGMNEHGDAGIKNQVDVRIDQVGDRTFSYRPDPGGACRGDSGGPALLSVDEREYIVGITSGGDPACSERAVYSRVDAYEAFIDGVLWDLTTIRGELSCAAQIAPRGRPRISVIEALAFAALAALARRRRRPASARRKRLAGRARFV